MDDGVYFSGSHTPTPANGGAGTRNGAQVLIDALVEAGVDTLFGYPGGAVLLCRHGCPPNSQARRRLRARGGSGAGDNGVRLCFSLRSTKLDFECRMPGMR